VRRIKIAMLLPLLLVLSARVALSSEIPSIIDSTDPAALPLWVAASTALTPTGELRSEFFWPSSVEQIEGNRVRNQERCTVYQSRGPALPAFDLLEERVSRAYTIFAGTVVGAEPGFFAGSLPGTLFAIDVTARPKAIGYSNTSKRMYVFVISADIPTALGRICSHPGPDGIVPQVGDRIIVLAHSPAQDANRQFVIVESRFGLILGRGASLLGVPAATDPRPSDVTGVLRAIERSKHLKTLPARSHH
jgi:hypothetical protein